MYFLQTCPFGYFSCAETPLVFSRFLQGFEVSKLLPCFTLLLSHFNTFYLCVKMKRKGKAWRLGGVSGCWVMLRFISHHCCVGQELWHGWTECGSLGVSSRDLVAGQGSSCKKLECLSKRKKKAASVYQEINLSIWISWGHIKFWLFLFRVWCWKPAVNLILWALAWPQTCIQRGKTSTKVNEVCLNQAACDVASHWRVTWRN